MGKTGESMLATKHCAKLHSCRSLCRKILKHPTTVALHVPLPDESSAIQLTGLVLLITVLRVPFVFLNRRFEEVVS